MIYKLNSKNEYSGHPNNESGMAAILITMIMMIVITIIVLGYTQVSNRELDASLNRELNTQAFYAAESGVNDARYAITNNYLTGNKTSCTGWPAPYDNGLLKPPNNNLGNNVQYTCLLITDNPTNPSFPAYTDESTVANIQTTSTINSINFSWVSNAPVYPLTTQDFSTCSADLNVSGDNFEPVEDAPCYLTNYANCTPAAPCIAAGVVRLDITPWKVTPTQNENPANLSQQTMTLFLVPIQEGTAPYYPTPITYQANSSGEGQVIGAKCSPQFNNANAASEEGCSATLNVSSLGLSQYYIRLLGIYAKSNVQVEAFNDIDGQNGSAPPLNIVNSQAIVDSTGEAGNALQRIQTVIPLQNLNGPSYAIQSTESICKRFTIDPTATPQLVFNNPNSGLPSSAYSSCFPN